MVRSLCSRQSPSARGWGPVLPVPPVPPPMLPPVPPFAVPPVPVLLVPPLPPGAPNVPPFAEPPGPVPPTLPTAPPLPPVPGTLPVQRLLGSEQIAASSSSVTSTPVAQPLQSAAPSASARQTWRGPGSSNLDPSSN